MIRYYLNFIAKFCQHFTSILEFWQAIIHLELLLANLRISFTQSFNKWGTQNDFEVAILYVLKRLLLLLLLGIDFDLSWDNPLNVIAVRLWLQRKVHVSFELEHPVYLFLTWCFHWYVLDAHFTTFHSRGLKMIDLDNNLLSSLLYCFFVCLFRKSFQNLARIYLYD